MCPGSRPEEVSLLLRWVDGLSLEDWKGVQQGPSEYYAALPPKINRLPGGKYRKNSARGAAAPCNPVADNAIRSPKGTLSIVSMTEMGCLAGLL